MSVTDFYAHFGEIQFCGPAKVFPFYASVPRIMVICVALRAYRSAAPRPNGSGGLLHCTISTQLVSYLFCNMWFLVLAVKSAACITASNEII